MRNDLTPADLLRLRLANQQLAARRFAQPGDVVNWLVAMQAQDYLGALWSVGVRLPPEMGITGVGITEAAVEQAIADRTIVRTWPMRGTLHFVAAADVRWLVELLGSRAVVGSAGRRRQLGLDEATLARSRAVCEEALAGGRCLSRPDMFALLERHGISPAGQRGYHILGYLAQTNVLCLGPRQGKQPTFTLLAEWVTDAPSRPRDEALATLARRYFAGHGPATLQDFVWWSGLKLSDARTAIALAGDALEASEADGRTYYTGAGQLDALVLPPAGDPPRVTLLPGFDEYLLGYQDRSLALDPQHANRIAPGSNGMFLATILVEGRVVGTWKRTLKRKTVDIAYDPFTPLDAHATALAAAAERYGRFLGLDVVTT